MQRNVLVRVAGDEAGKSLSKAQKTFSRWTERIEAQRCELTAWQSLNETFTARLAAEVDPLRRRIAVQRMALLRALDRAHLSGELTRREQGRLATVIVERAAAWLIDDDSPDLVALHDRYSDVPYTVLRSERANAACAQTEGFESAKGVQGEDEIDQGSDWPNWSESTRPRSARAQARLDRRQRATEGATRSVKDVYRKLASALHPDREIDPIERDRKTALMQRVNQTYADKDLLKLLSLQLEVEQIDPTYLAGVSDDRLQHYNRVLKAQSEALDRELAGLVEPFRQGPERSAARKLTPADVLATLQRDVAALRRELQQLAHELALFKDVRTVKAWMKNLRISRKGRDPH